MSAGQVSEVAARLRADADKLIKRADAIDTAMKVMSGMSTGAVLRIPLTADPASPFACAVLNYTMWSVSGDTTLKTTDQLLAWLEDNGIEFDRVRVLMKGLTS